MTGVQTCALPIWKSYLQYQVSQDTLVIFVVDLGILAAIGFNVETVQVRNINGAGSGVYHQILKLVGCSSKTYLFKFGIWVVRLLTNFYPGVFSSDFHLGQSSIRSVRKL